MLLNIPSWIAKKWQDDSGEQAADALREDIQKNKTGRQKTVDFAENIISPVGLGKAGLQATGKVMSKVSPTAISKLLAKYGGSAAQGAVMSGTAGVTNSKTGEALADGTINTGIGLVSGPLVQAGIEKVAKSGARLLGRGSDVSDPYFANPDKYNNPDISFENTKAKVQAPIDTIKGSVETGKMGLEAAEKSVDDLRLNLKEQFAEEKGRAEEALGLARSKYTSLEQMLLQAERDGKKQASEELASAMQRVKEEYDDILHTARTAHSTKSQTAQSQYAEAIAKARIEFADALASRKKPELPADLPGRIKEAVKGQRSAVSKGSSDSFDILAESGQKVDMEPVKAQIMRALEPETIMGQKVPASMTPERKVLAKYAKILAGVEGPQDPGEAKKLIQAIQKDLQEVYAADVGAYKSKGQRAIQDVEGILQDSLKNKLDVGPKFKEKMAEVAADTNLAKDASKTFGKRDILPALYSLRNAPKAKQLAVLKQLATKHDPEIISTLEKFWSEADEFSSPSTKRALWESISSGIKKPVTGPVPYSNPADKRKLWSEITKEATSPAGEKIDFAKLQARINAPSTAKAQTSLSDEARLLAEAEDGLLPYQREYLKPAIENQIAESPQYTARNQAAQSLELAQSRMEPVKKFMNRDSEDLIRANMLRSDRKPNLEEKDALEYLSKIGGEDLVDNVDTLRVKSAFSGGTPNGSRMVNVGRSLGKAVGSAVGLPKPGEALGAFVGATVDYTSGFTAKKMLDTAIKIRNPAVRATALVVGPIMDRIMSNSAGEKYAAYMDKQAERGPEAMLAAHQALMKSDPEYAKIHAQERVP
jgi:hypothetical protein